jgi:uncharacterized peroxidase-related enzyme
MRLTRIETGQPLRYRLLLRIIGATSGHVPDILRAVMYRPAFFGKPYSALAHRSLRGASPWTVEEREVFAAFVSRQNQCAFCQTAHGAVASHTLGDPTLEAVLTDWRTAPVSEPVRATLGFLQQLTLAPETVTPADIAPLRAQGLTDAHIADAIAICTLFCIINRVADALDFRVPTPEEARHDARSLLKRGYRF